MIVVHRVVVVALRVFLFVLFGVLVLFQVMSLPGQFADAGALRWPATIISIFLVLCVQVVVVATWKLLTMVQRDRIFTDGAMRWVDAIVGAIAAGWVVLVGVFLLVGFNADDPGPVLLLFLATTGVTVVGLLMVVMRALLKQATTLRTDMESVI